MAFAQSASTSLSNRLPSLPSGMLESAQAEARSKYEAPDDAGAVKSAAASAFQTLAVAGVTLMVVVYVVMMIDGSLEVEEGNQFSESYNTITSTLGDAFNLAAVALIVLVASVILYYVSGFGGGNRIGG